MKLFAHKGVTATSIQDIASESGISKGAFYLYFQSKEALLLAILKYYSNAISERVREVEQLGLPLREQFEHQLEVQLAEIMQHKSFIIMHMREFALPFNHDIAVLVYQMRAESNQFFRNNILQIYGERAAAYVHDLTLLLQGIHSACMELILFNTDTIDPKRVASYITKRLDNLVEGFEVSLESPLLSHDMWMPVPCSEIHIPLTSEAEVKDQLTLAVKQALDKARVLPNSDHLAVSLELLQQEMVANVPRLPLIEGMLHNLSAYPIHHALRDSIRGFYKLKLDSVDGGK